MGMGLTVWNVVLNFVLIWHVKGLAFHASSFTLIPPSTNPSSKLNRALLQELKDKLQLKDSVTISGGRFWFSITNHATPPFRTWGSLLYTGVRLVRIVVLDEHVMVPTSCPPERETLVEYLVDNLVNNSDFIPAFKTFEMFGNKVPSNPTIHVSCRLLADSALKQQGLSASNLCRQFAQGLSKKHSNWLIARKQKEAQLHFNLVLHQECRATLELMTLVPSKVVGELPHPGFKRVESWVVAKSASIVTDEVVVDPMCGCASFLVEAATFWPSAKYIGIDNSREQLQHAQANIDAAQVSVELIHADSTCYMSQFENASVNKIVCCPPFGKQFAIRDEPLQFYKEMLKEWCRWLRPTGKMVLVIDLENLDSLVQALFENHCQVDALREFQLGKHLRATIVVACKVQPSNGELAQELPPRDKLPWEKGLEKEFRGRALWTQARARSLPALVPVNAPDMTLRLSMNTNSSL